MAIERHIGPGDGVFVNEDKTLTVTIYQADGVTAQNITGWTLSWMVKNDPKDSDAAARITKTTTSGIALTTPASGICTITVAAADTAPLVAGDAYVHELRRTNAGAKTVLMSGRFTLSASVHRT